MNIVPRISVVMCCYHGDRLESLKEAIESILNQSINFHEFIIVVDGPVSEEIFNFLKNIRDKKDRLFLFFLEKNGGTAVARNYGISKSSGEYIAIMDADDIALPTRLEDEIKILADPKIDAIWSWQEEFFDESKKSAGFKRSSQNHDQIVQQLKFRCLLPEPSLMMKRICWEKSGGYTKPDFGSDHRFYISLVLNGFQLFCIQKTLVMVRVCDSQRARRGGWKAIRSDVSLRYWMYKNKFIKLSQLMAFTLIFLSFRILPNSFRNYLYVNILRSRS